MEKDVAVFSRIERETACFTRPMVIGISGAYTSGKTIFADKLARYFAGKGQKAQVIHYDDFHRPLSAIKWTDEKNSEIDAFYSEAFDPQKLVAEILKPLKSDGCINKTVACIDWGTGQHSNMVDFNIDADSIVLLEGVLLFRAPLLGYLNYKVFLDITAEEMLRRGRARDVPQFGEGILEKYRQRYIPVHEKYLKQDRPKEMADIVIDNNAYDTPTVL